jgi:hypothetical protein
LANIVICVNETVAERIERTGFPFSIQDDSGKIIGDLNAFRFPQYMELNLHFERRFGFRGHRWAF